MPDPSTTPRQVVEIDERWIAEWVGFGMKQLCIYLEFADYCDQRDKRPEEHQP